MSDIHCYTCNGPCLVDWTVPDEPDRATKPDGSVSREVETGKGEH